MQNCPTLRLRPTAAPEPGDTPMLLGEWLVHRKILSRDQLAQALELGQRHEWRIGDAVVVLGLAPRARVEQEAAQLDRHRGPREPSRSHLERIARWMELEAQSRRGGDLQT